jgi:DNA-binding beta-propeller fold protein YncE
VDGLIKSKKRKAAFIARSPATTSPMSELASGQIHSQVGAHGETQTPVQTIFVQVLRSTRMLSRSARMDEASKRRFPYFLFQQPPLVAPTGRMALATMAVALALQVAALAEPLQFQAKIPLGSVKGRIDHMAFDSLRKRLLVAELGNDSVGVVDLKENKTVHMIAGLAEPQGVGYVPTTDTVYVANARDSSVRLFRGDDYTLAGKMELGSDADNIRFDVAANRLLIGYGDGALAAIDVVQGRKIADFRLPAHPESFQIDHDRNRIFVNVPNAHGIAVLDAASGKETSKWSLREGGNFPMAIDPSNGRVLVVSRNPPKLKVYAEEDGALVASVDTCGDSDDVFVDPKRPRVYVSCGAGFIDVFDVRGASYERVSHIKTVTGARTSLLVSELDVFLLAVRATITEEAAVWVYKPQP